MFRGIVIITCSFNFFELILQDEKQLKRWGLWAAYVVTAIVSAFEDCAGDMRFWKLIIMFRLLFNLEVWISEFLKNY